MANCHLIGGERKIRPEVKRRRKTIMGELELEDNQFSPSKPWDRLHEGGKGKIMLGVKRQRTTVMGELEVEDSQFRPSRQWDELHQPLLEMILCRLPLPDYFRFPVVCQSWLRVQRESCCTTSLAFKFPWLVLFKSPSCTSFPSFYSLSEKRLYQIPLPLEPPSVERYEYRSSEYGWLLLNRYVRADRTIEGFFLHPISGVKIILPRCEGLWHRNRVALTLPPADPNCVVAVPRREGFALCRLGDQMPHWRICGPVPSHDLKADYADEIHDTVFCSDKFYGLTGDFNIVTLDSNTLEFQKLEMDRTVLPEWHARCLTSLLVCQEELFLITALDINIGKPEAVIADVEIQAFRADLSQGAWTRIWSFGGHDVFVSESGATSLNRSNYSAGGRGNVIYLTHPRFWFLYEGDRSPDNQWFLLEYDLKDGAICYHRHLDEIPQTIHRNLFWVEPTLT